MERASKGLVPCGATSVRQVASHEHPPLDNFGPCPGYYCSSNRNRARKTKRPSARLRSGSQIRCATPFGKPHPFPERQHMHVHCADDVAVSLKSAFGTARSLPEAEGGVGYPSPPFRAMATTTLGTSGAGVTLAPGEALESGPFTLLL